jgi:hypothetical protein
MSECFVSTTGLTEVGEVPKDEKTAKLLSLPPVFIARDLQYVEELVSREVATVL